MRNLLQHELHDNYPKLYNKAVIHWQNFVGALLADGMGGELAWIGLKTHNSRVVALGVAGLVATGFTLGRFGTIT